MHSIIMDLSEWRSRLEQGALLTQAEINALADKSVEILIQEPNVIEVGGPRYLVGDVHGQFYDFLKMIKEVSKDLSIQFLKTVAAFS